MDARLSPAVPSAYGSLIANSVLLYRKTFYRVFLLSLCVALIVFIPRILSTIIGEDIFHRGGPFNLNRLWLIALDFVSMIFIIGIFCRIYFTAKAEHEPISDDLNIGVHKVLSIFFASILQGMILCVCVLACYGLQYILHQYDLLNHDNPIGLFFLFGTFSFQLFIILYILTLFVFVIPLVAIENKGVFNAIEKSVSLTWNHWWRVFSVQMTPWIIYSLVLMGLRDFFHLDIHLYFTELTNPSYLATIINVALFTLYIPWYASLMLVQLRDLELRKAQHEQRKALA